MQLQQQCVASPSLLPFTCSSHAITERPPTARTAPLCWVLCVTQATWIGQAACKRMTASTSMTLNLYASVQVDKLYHRTVDGKA
eukprot:6443-Heterococcus_DN1.PRE.1